MSTGVLAGYQMDSLKVRRSTAPSTRLTRTSSLLRCVPRSHSANQV
ncbi:MAG: hypothetical protein R2794_00745 [Chitinophagales bacterium]